MQYTVALGLSAVTRIDHRLRETNPDVVIGVLQHQPDRAADTDTETEIKNPGVSELIGNAADKSLLARIGPTWMIFKPLDHLTGPRSVIEPVDGHRMSASRR